MTDWEPQGDGIWTLAVEGGTVLFTSKDTAEERARFAEQWKRGQKPPEPCEDENGNCRAYWPNYHRRHLPPPRIVPVEHCGDLNPSAVGADQAECVLRPGHSGSHADDRGCRWRTSLRGVIQTAQQQYRTEQGEETTPLEALGYHAMGQGIDLERIQQQRDQLAAGLQEVLNVFSTVISLTGTGEVVGYLAKHPIHPDDMNRWRAALSTTEGESK